MFKYLLPEFGDWICVFVGQILDQIRHVSAWVVWKKNNKEFFFKREILGAPKTRNLRGRIGAESIRHVWFLRGRIDSINKGPNRLYRGRDCRGRASKVPSWQKTVWPRKVNYDMLIVICGDGSVHICNQIRNIYNALTWLLVHWHVTL